jgi:hypothetical protein
VVLGAPAVAVPVVIGGAPGVAVPVVVVVVPGVVVVAVPVVLSVAGVVVVVVEPSSVLVQPTINRASTPAASRVITFFIFQPPELSGVAPLIFLLF